MTSKLDTRRILIFLAFAFGIAWLTGLAVYLTGGLTNGVQLAPGVPLALLLLAVPYMWAPALANIFTRLLTGEGWRDTGLRPHFRRGWPYWLMGWFLPTVMTVAGAALFFLLFPATFDPALSQVRRLMGNSPMLAALTPWTIVLIVTVQATLLAPVVNVLATFGEEFGWRAYLLPKLLPLGWRKASLLIGLIWGVWHWPVIFMGYEYGFTYPGYPWAGPLLFIWVTFCFGVFLGWLALKGGSVWPAAIGHAAINGIAGLSILFVAGAPNPLLGPSPVGAIGLMGYTVVGLALFFFSNPVKAAIPEPQPGPDVLPTQGIDGGGS
jgi:membrane protease YdiL (CAAX protease family)